MTYNIHPLFVHFPIALLFIYSIIKVLPLEKWMPNVSWKHIERALLFFGVLGAFVATSTGEVAENLTRPNHQLVEMHSTFAAISTWIYAILLGGEVLVVIRNKFESKLDTLPNFKKIYVFLQNIITNEILVVVLALIALITISVTGLLGGVMVYGTSADPVAGIVLKILGINL